MPTVVARVLRIVGGIPGVAAICPAGFLAVDGRVRRTVQLESCLRRGSNLSLNQSPKKLNASTVRKIANPGNRATHQAVSR